jgi:hypothetical protein
MTRLFWIVGLLVALLVYGSITFICIVALIKHRHLNLTGITMLLGNGYVSWITLKYLLFKIGVVRPEPSAQDDDQNPQLPKLW